MRFDPAKRPSLNNPGGGVSTKLVNLQRAIPDITLTSKLEDCGDIIICESLWFNGGANDGKIGTGDAFAARVSAYAKSESYKVLWMSDVECLRWTGEERAAIFAASDVVAANSIYMRDALKSYLPDIALLTDPVDTSQIAPLKKEKSIFSMSQVTAEKNIDTIIDCFDQLGECTDLKRGFVGSSGLWGLTTDEEAGQRFDAELRRCTDWLVPAASRAEVSEIAGKAWGFITDSGYDTFNYALVETMLAGCWCFCGRHPVFDGRPVIRFESALDASGKIKDTIEQQKWSQGLPVNEEARQFVIDNYSLRVFRRQFEEVVGYGF